MPNGDSHMVWVNTDLVNSINHNLKKKFSVLQKHYASNISKFIKNGNKLPVYWVDGITGRYYTPADIRRMPHCYVDEDDNNVYYYPMLLINTSCNKVYYIMSYKSALLSELVRVIKKSDNIYVSSVLKKTKPVLSVCEIIRDGQCPKCDEFIEECGCFNDIDNPKSLSRKEAIVAMMSGKKVSPAVKEEIVCVYLNYKDQPFQYAKWEDYEKGETKNMTAHLFKYKKWVIW